MELAFSLVIFANVAGTWRNGICVFDLAAEQTVLEGERETDAPVCVADQFPDKQLGDHALGVESPVGQAGADQAACLAHRGWLGCQLPGSILAIAFGGESGEHGEPADNEAEPAPMARVTAFADDCG
ncbi:hypothetical protein ACIBHX_51215 [Nonomuraea sp. NPDC050536]|uniref:hypothetical protein n=1 Tax=Nonomuraea sp. NPDC050536 TaxID=3364366 RepID=UPI0037C6D936